MKTFKIIGIAIGTLIIIIGLSFALGFTDVLFTRTVTKAQRNADREVFEETQSYVEGKRQQALKYYKEYNTTEDAEAKKAIAEVVSMTFANFDESKLPSKLEQFIKTCKYE